MNTRRPVPALYAAIAQHLTWRPGAFYFYFYFESVNAGCDAQMGA